MYRVDFFLFDCEAQAMSVAGQAPTYCKSARVAVHEGSLSYLHPSDVTLAARMTFQNCNKYLTVLQCMLKMLPS
jgi:hypothetical protein